MLVICLDGVNIGLALNVKYNASIVVPHPPPLICIRFLLWLKAWEWPEMQDGERTEGSVGNYRPFRRVTTLNNEILCVVCT